ncbi:N-acetyltransferase [uncultured Hyphomonas sp.]|jgi:ribosomal protein S18 acetylase RimI-like enzyme|uniref:GNAT family N-acetyltransferase n=1 Tax=uncultured Hyphomonas sp. TaxID=225298 RepID=UPI000C69DD28|nr:GNAT family N-acetyltransferase [Hyphomonadaceae bacterium]|tara:strand:+ start:34606 stop:35070 length:465 start_codon:yes stop_codon:yes gene_type:complete
MQDIRAANPDDIAALTELERAFPEEDRFSQRTWARLMRGNSAILVSDGDGGLTGAAVLLFRRTSQVARLYSLSVAEAARGTGLSGRLLEKCEDISRQRHCGLIRLEVRETNSRAKRLYERHGYRVMARAAGYYPDGEAALKMEKPLSGLSREVQ